MRPDIVNLRQFYSSQLGRRVKARLCRVVRAHWPNYSGGLVVGVGYTLPLLRVIERMTDATVISVMPAAQGAIYWPVHSANRCILGDEMRLPFAENSVSRLLMLHVLEHAHAPEELLQGVWRVLQPGGQLLLMVPRTKSAWSRQADTPFGAGSNFTLAELKQLLADAHFTLREVSTGLMTPPRTHPFWLALHTPMEWLGRVILSAHGGLIIIEAEKQIYAGVGERHRAVAPPMRWRGAAPVLNTSRSSRKTVWKRF